MSAEEYCNTCCKSDVCKLRDDFIGYYKKADELIKPFPEFFNDIKCRKHLKKPDTMRTK